MTSAIRLIILDHYKAAKGYANGLSDLSQSKNLGIYDPILNFAGSSARESRFKVEAVLGIPFCLPYLSNVFSKLLKEICFVCVHFLSIGLKKIGSLPIRRDNKGSSLIGRVIFITNFTTQKGDGQRDFSSKPPSKGIM